MFGIVLTALNLFTLAALALLPIFGIYQNIDPFYHVFEAFLPSAYDRSLSQIIGIVFVRLFFTFVCLFEFTQFSFIITMTVLSIYFTLCSCFFSLSQLSPNRDTLTLHLYTQLRVFLYHGDYVIRNVMAIILFCLQVMVTLEWWFSLKGWGILSTSVSIFICTCAFFTTALILIFLPLGVELSARSKRFVKDRVKHYHGYNRCNPKYFWFLRWMSQQLLPIRFGTQFILDYDTLLGYFESLIGNITDAVILINP